MPSATPATASLPPSAQSSAAAPLAKPRAGGRRVLMQGESTVATIGISVAAILVVAMGLSGYWLMRNQRSQLAAADQQRVAALGGVLAQSCQRLLASGDLSSVRSLLVEAGTKQHLTVCRLVAPDGHIVADMQPGKINASLVQNVVWRGNFDTERAGPSPAPVSVPQRFAVQLPKHHLLMLQIAATPLITPTQMWHSQAGVGLIAIAALLALWLVYRHLRTRLAGIGMVREALLAHADGESTESALAVASYLGAEAQAWNQVLEEHQRLRREATMQKARDAMAPALGGGEELVAGCDAMSQGLILFSAGSKVQYANNAAAVFLRTDRAGLRSKTLEDLIDDEAVRQAVQSATAGQSRRRSVHEVDQSDQGRGVLRFVVHPIHQDAHTPHPPYTPHPTHASSTAHTSAMLVIEDVTQQRVAERSRHDFVAQATHELRTPLTNIRLYLETAQDEGESDPTIRAKALNVMNQETQRLERMVGDMLSVAEIEAGSLKLERDDVRLDELFISLDADYQAQAKEKQLTLQMKLPPKLPVIQADRDKLAMAVQNLIGNAMKYTPSGGRVTVTVEPRAGQLQIEVADTGLGIAAEDVEHLFNKFYRAKDRRIAGISGSGLGLALAREIVRLHGGDITCESQIDHGSRFTITMPIVEAVAA